MLCLYILLAIQIIAESFPISSSGHILLFSSIAASYFNCIFPPIVTTSWFNHLLHIPTIFIVIVFFLKKYGKTLWLYCNTTILMYGIGMSFIVNALTTLFYVFFMVISIRWFPVGLGFFCTAVLLYLLKFMRDDNREYSWWCVAMWLGIAQGIALLPGISRFAITYVVARWFGISADKSFMLSWLLFFPLLVLCAGHGLLGLYLHGLLCELLHPIVWLIILGSSIASWYAFYMVYYMSSKNIFYYFSWYMLVPLILWLLFV